jgi:DNA-binding response OmpR family regulator
MKSNRTIALIDDDDGPTRYYEAALTEAEFAVVRLKSFVEALTFIHTLDQPSPDLWIFDVMMPISEDSLEIDGVDVAKETNRGLAAGMFLYQELRKKDKSTPVMLLTSITTPAMLDVIEGSLLPGDLCEAKLDYTPSKLVEHVKSVLDESPNNPKHLQAK